jgi:hypothetical protein
MAQKLANRDSRYSRELLIKENALPMERVFVAFLSVLSDLRGEKMILTRYSDSLLG